MIVHLPTPYDHFSPRTGSAVMTVIDGLARGDSGRERHRVLIAHGTYPDRYGSADVIEYAPGPWVDGRKARVDALAARAGLGRPFARSSYRRAIAEAPADDHVLLLHNAPFTGWLTPARSTPVLYAHNEILPGPRFATARAVGGFAGIIAVSDWLAGRILDRLGGARAVAVSSVLNGVDTEKFPMIERIEHDRVNILFIGRMIPQKGPDLLVDALIRVGDARADLRIVGSSGFSGSSPLTAYERQLRALASQLPGGVEFIPFVDREQVLRHYGWADLVVLPARWEEPCGLTLLEAMATGAAIVISRSGGMPEVAGNAAVHVSRGDVEMLAEAIDGLVKDPSVRHRLGILARARAEALDWPSRTAQLHDVLSGWK